MEAVIKRSPGMLMIILGAAHNLATPVVADLFTDLPRLEYSIFLLMFIGTGTAVILADVAQLVTIKSRAMSPRERHWAFAISGFFVAAIGIAAVLITPWNPVAYLLAGVEMVGAMETRHIRT